MPNVKVATVLVALAVLAAVLAVAARCRSPFVPATVTVVKRGDAAQRLAAEAAEADVRTLGLPPLLVLAPLPMPFLTPLAVVPPVGRAGRRVPGGGLAR